MDRRAFVGAMAGLVAARRQGGMAPSVADDTTTPSIVPSPAALAPSRLAPVGLQLYTVRTLMEQSVERTLEQVAAIGYQEVEFAGYFGRTPAQVRAALKAHGLRAPASHVPVDAVRNNLARTLDDAREVGHEWILVAWLPEQDRTADGTRAVADLFNNVGAEAKQRGLKFAYHNHDFEFAPLGNGNAYDLLLARCDPKLVDFEMDLYWATKGGVDPLFYWRTHPGRFPLVHVKDSKGPPDHQMVDVGSGAIHWQRLFAQRKLAGIKHYFVEHDNSPDPLASAKSSFEYLSQLKV